MEIMHLSFNSSDDFVKVRQFFQNQPDWEILPEAEIRGRPTAKAFGFKLKRKTVKKISRVVDYLSLAVNLLNLGISFVSANNMENRGEINLVKIENNQTTIIVNNVIVADSLTVEQLRQLVEQGRQHGRADH